jgi:molecular chaperone DnaK
MEKINKAWEAAAPEMQKAAQEAQGATQEQANDAGQANEGDNVEDVDFEEVKED